MNFTLSDDEYGVTLSDRDVEVARSLREIVRDGRELLDGVKQDEFGKCEMCISRAWVRGFPLIQDGQFFIADLCAGCQAEKIREKKQQYQDQQQETNESSDSLDLSGLLDGLDESDVTRYQEHYGLESMGEVVRHRFEQDDPDGVLE